MAEAPTTTSKSPRIDSNMMGHPVFGNLLENPLPQNRLPTYLQVLNRVRFLKSQRSHRLDPVRPIYNLVGNELSTIWKDAFVVPVLNPVPLATKLERDIEKKINSVSSNISRIVNNPQKLETELSEMKKVFSISKCRCFLQTKHRQDVLRSNCHCDNPIVNLECYGDQLFGFNQIIVFEEEKVAFTQKIAEMEEAQSLPPTPPSSAEKVDAGYGKTYLATKRARPNSYGNQSGPEDDDMEVPDQIQDEVNWDPVLETMLAQGLKPFAIMKIISKFLITIINQISIHTHGNHYQGGGLSSDIDKITY